MIKVLILALCVNWIRAQNVDDAIRDLYMKIDSLEQENMEIHRELDFLENEVTGTAHPSLLNYNLQRLFMLASHPERYEKSNLKP